PGTPLSDQARYIAANAVLPAALRTSRGYSENLNFWRIREVSANYFLPESFSRRFFRSQSSNVVFGARNLHVWSSYTGEDPEANYSTGNPQSDLLNSGPATLFTVPLTVNYS